MVIKISILLVFATVEALLTKECLGIDLKPEVELWNKRTQERIDHANVLIEHRIGQMDQIIQGRIDHANILVEHRIKQIDQMIQERIDQANILIEHRIGDVSVLAEHQIGQLNDITTNNIKLANQQFFENIDHANILVEHQIKQFRNSVICLIIVSFVAFFLLLFKRTP